MIEPALDVEVRAHPLGEDAQAREDRSRAGQRAGGRSAGERKRVPLGLPLAGRALVRALHRDEQGAGVLRGQDAEPDDGLAADRVRLLRHRRGRAAEVASFLAHLADLGPRELDDLARELAARGGRRGEHEPGLGQRRRARCARERRRRPARASRRHRGAPPGSAGRARRPCRRRRRAARRRPSSGRSRSRCHVPGQLGEPDRRLAAERDRHGGLRVRPARHHRRAVLLGQGRELVAERIDEASRSGRARGRGGARAPVSMMSWVVAPQWMCRAASGEACAICSRSGRIG